DIIEIGGESTRPGAEPVAADQELARIAPVIEALAGRITIPIAVDTCKGEVARHAVRLGASLVNDVSALRFDPAIARVSAESGAGLVLMHMRGNPSIMQKLPASDDVFREIELDLSAAVQTAENAGVIRDQLILDPGIGFGKTAQQNLAIINHLERVLRIGFPVMVGTSRKKFIGALTGKAEHERVFGTAATVAAAILRGAHLVRVHDVEAMIDVVKLADAIAQAP
ncbi:MAG TPA: dihydropteroate synthase, partial [Blastocatellia bacterium]|nr:dihydropteroate synthase [Blastocatellia bacterium]